MIVGAHPPSIYGSVPLLSICPFPLIRGQQSMLGSPVGRVVVDGMTRARTIAFLTTVVDKCELGSAALYAAHLEACVLVFSGGKCAEYSSTVSRLAHALDADKQLPHRVCLRDMCPFLFSRGYEAAVCLGRDGNIAAQVADILTLAQGGEESATATAATVTTVSSTVECPGCGLKEGILHSDAQLRSIDEGMNVMCVCPNPNCGRRWKL